MSKSRQHNLVKLVAIKFEKVYHWFELFHALKRPENYLYASGHYTLFGGRAKNFRTQLNFSKMSLKTIMMIQE